MANPLPRRARILHALAAFAAVTLVAAAGARPDDVAAPAARPEPADSPASRPDAAHDPTSRPDAAHAPAARPLPFFYDLYTFRGHADSTLVLAAYAVPLTSLERQRIGRDVRYRFDVTLVLADTSTGKVYRTDDSVHVRVPGRHDRRHLLSTHISVQAPPSATMLQYVVMIDATTPGIGQLYTDDAAIPDYRGTRLMISDIALSRPSSVQGWRHRDVTLALLPTGEFPRSAFDVYYEIYNLPGGHRYTTEIAVQRVADARGRPATGDAPVRVRYADRSNARRDGTVAELRHVDASVSSGRYRITLTITDQESGETASRTRAFQVSDWATDATFLDALPRGLRDLRPGGR
jgi:hypothetical protein